jgi:hypothetical protein
MNDLRALANRAPDWVGALLGYRVPATSLSLTISFVAAVYGTWQGLTIALSDPRRFKNPVYAIMDGHAPVWGAAVFACGVLILLGLVLRNFWLKAVGLLGLSAWHAIFAIYSFQAELSLPDAASTPTPVYAFVAITLAVLVWMDEKRLATYANVNLRAR